MPAKDFICPDSGKVSIDDCLQETGCRMSNRCATRSYLRLISQERKWTGRPSTTQLINGTNLAYLRLTRDYAISPGDRAFMAHGTKVHARMQIDDDYSIMEERLDDIDSNVSGIFDVYEVEDGKHILVDYKTSGSYKVAKALGMWVDQEPTGEVYKSGKRKGEPKTIKVLKRDDEHIDRHDWDLQLNFYRIGLERRGYQVDEMRIMCIVRDGNTWIARSRGVYRNIYYFKVPRLDDDYVLSYFRRKKNALMVALKYGWSKPCSGEENWNGLRCESYCEVAEFCNYGKYLKKEREVEDMAIKGLSETRRLPRQGKIALGKMLLSPKGVEYPSETSYFVLRPSTPSEEEQKRLIAKFHELYGEEPTSIKIMFPVADREQIFPQYWKRYGKSSGLKCKGDGEVATCMSEEFAKGLKQIGDSEGLPMVECLGEECPYAQKNECSRMATLQVLLYEMPGAGVWQMTTGSINSIININSALDWIEAMAGRCHMIPLMLQRVPTQIQHEEKSRTHYPLNIDMNVELKQLLGWANVDASKVLIQLPEISGDQEDVVFQTTPEQAVHEPAPALPEPPEQEADDSTYAGAVSVLAERWDEDEAVVKTFLIKAFKTEAQAFKSVRNALSDAGTMEKAREAFDRWLGAADVPVYDSKEPVQDAPETTPANSDGSEVEMDSPEATQGKIDAKVKHINELVAATPFKVVSDNGFRSWMYGILDPECKGIPLERLSIEDLNIIIGELETRETAEADAEAEELGEADLF